MDCLSIISESAFCFVSFPKVPLPSADYIPGGVCVKVEGE